MAEYEELNQEKNKEPKRILKGDEVFESKKGDDGILPTDPVGNPVGVSGCTDPNSSNYNPLATVDDGSCIPCIYGCMNTASGPFPDIFGNDENGNPCVYPCTDVNGFTNIGYAFSNHNPNATCDDGSCQSEILGCMDCGYIWETLTGQFCNKVSPSSSPGSTNYNPFATYTDNKCLWEGCMDPLSSNYVGNPLFPAGFGLGLTPSTSTIYPWVNSAGEGGFVTSLPNLCNPYTYGCTDPNACNYDPLADYDDNTCYFPSCTDNTLTANGTAINYDPNATTDCNCDPIGTFNPGWNSCCEYDIVDCTDPNALNYNPAATIPCFSCCEYPVGGCTDPTALNYNFNCAGNAVIPTFDDGCCSYPGIPGCMDPLAVNYCAACNISVPSDCIYEGCTDPIASNFNPNASIEDGSCIFLGCTDPNSTNFFAPAGTWTNPVSSITGTVVDDGTCVYPVLTDPDRFGWVDSLVKSIDVFGNPLAGGINISAFRSIYFPGMMGSGWGELYLKWKGGWTGDPNAAFMKRRYEGVIGGDTFQWQPCTTDTAGNQWDLSDFDDANNAPDAHGVRYFIKMWAADGSYIGTWGYERCVSATKSRNWVKAQHGFGDGSTIPWYGAIPQQDDPTETTSTTFADKMDIKLEGVHYVDCPNGQVYNYGYSLARTELNGTQATDGYLDANRSCNWDGFSYVGCGNINDPIWNNELGIVAGAPTKGHSNYENDYMEGGWLGRTVGHAFIQFDCDRALTKPNAQPNVFSATNNVYQQKMVVCAKKVIEYLQSMYNPGGGNIAGLNVMGGYMGIGGIGGSVIEQAENINGEFLINRTYGSFMVPGLNGNLQNLDRIVPSSVPGGAISGGTTLLPHPNTLFPKHYYWPWYADYPPPINSLLLLYNNFTDALNDMRNSECTPHPLRPLPPSEDTHTWDLCGFKDNLGQVHNWQTSFGTTWVTNANNPQGPLVFDYLGVNSTGDDFYNDISNALGQFVAVNEVVEIDFAGLGGYINVAGFLVAKLYVKYKGTLPWDQQISINGLPGQPPLVLWNNCGSALGHSIVDPSNNSTKTEERITKNSYKFEKV